MSPRAYQLGQRQASVDDTRRRVLTAARELLTEPSGYAVFTVDAIARKADVARATIYYRFGSKAGLLEALFDDLAAEGQLEQLAEAFTEPDPDRALRRFVACFGEFWASDRLVLRRLRALGALDPDVGPLITARDERRRAGLRTLLSRRAGAETSDALEAQVAIALTLTSFETFDTLAGPERDLRDLVPVVTDLVLHAITAAAKAPPEP